MISCSFKDLQIIHSKVLSSGTQLQKIMATLQPADSNLFKEATPESVFSIISSYVSRLFEEIVEVKELFNNSVELEGDMYEKIEIDLQKQEHLNRMLIKKQLEFKEYQKCLEDELKTQKTNTKKLQNRLEKYNTKIVNKDLELHHLTSEKRVLAKDKKNKDVTTLDTPFKDKKMSDGFKTLTKDLFSDVKPTHRRRQSDDIYKKSSTGASKRKMSAYKR